MSTHADPNAGGTSLVDLLRATPEPGDPTWMRIRWLLEVAERCEAVGLNEQGQAALQGVADLLAGRIAHVAGQPTRGGGFR
ncbi:hypothetical protein [Amycolatopsis suaedae]|uniref:Uncharacterized protein n=1 Tax=Amycolatopsis suaedae TaxID=2510978 RepID=A0A4Q7J900_9PSEU|nr:hypothetical protein [Amycolatopsis suaedae]RZQ64210.1 hypothetical protein EWH70_09505 [Amycolatopsis suaedae]